MCTQVQKNRVIRLLLLQETHDNYRAIAFIVIRSYFNITGQAKGIFTVMSKKSLLNSIIALLLCALISAPGLAQVYKWVDESGQVHYADRPETTQAEQVKIRQNETTTPRAKDKEKIDYLKDKNKAKSEQAEELKEQKMSNKEKRKLCNEAKSDLQAIMSRGRVREINEKGEYTYLTEEQRQQRISAARKKQKEFCR
jgi:dsRNA-specific ribonuclease